MRLLTLFVLALALAGCPHPGPAPVTPPGPAPVVSCDGSVPDDVLNNDIVNAAQIQDDSASFAALDAVAATPGRSIDVVRCACAMILPDLRNAAVTGVHLAAWLANHGGTP